MKIEKNIYLTSFLLRVALAVVFLYAGMSSILYPESWVGFIPEFVSGIIDPSIFLIAHAIAEIALAIWILSDKAILYSSSIAALFMFGIIISNVGAFDIVFRDVAILLMAVALIALNYRR